VIGEPTSSCWLIYGWFQAADKLLLSSHSSMGEMTIPSPQTGLQTCRCTVRNQLQVKTLEDQYQDISRHRYKIWINTVCNMTADDIIHIIQVTVTHIYIYTYTYILYHIYIYIIYIYHMSREFPENLHVQCHELTSWRAPLRQDLMALHMSNLC
jgi:hypothetical protein